MGGKFNNTQGNSLIELTMVMMLLILFGFTIFTIIYSSSNAQQKLLANKDTQIDARIALSYVDVKIRQNDAVGAVNVVENPETGQDSILIRNETAENPYDIWIFYHDNGIYEFLGLPGELPSVDYSILILGNEDLSYTVDFDEEKKCITNTISYKYGNDIKDLSAISYLRSSSY